MRLFFVSLVLDADRSLDFLGTQQEAEGNGGSFLSRFTGVQLSARTTLITEMRDTPPYRAIPFRDSIAEGGIAPICLVFIGYRASVAEIPL